MASTGGGGWWGGLGRRTARLQQRHTCGHKGIATCLQGARANLTIRVYSSKPDRRQERPRARIAGHQTHRRLDRLRRPGRRAGPAPALRGGGRRACCGDNHQRCAASLHLESPIPPGPRWRDRDGSRFVEQQHSAPVITARARATRWISPPERRGANGGGGPIPCGPTDYRRAWRLVAPVAPYRIPRCGVCNDPASPAAETPWSRDVWRAGALASPPKSRRTGCVRSTVVQETAAAATTWTCRPH